MAVTAKMPATTLCPRIRETVDSDAPRAAQPVAHVCRKSCFVKCSAPADLAESSGDRPRGNVAFEAKIAPAHLHGFRRALAQQEEKSHHRSNDELLLAQ